MINTFPFFDFFFFLPFFDLSFLSNSFPFFELLLFLFFLSFFIAKSFPCFCMSSLMSSLSKNFFKFEISFSCCSFFSTSFWRFSPRCFIFSPYFLLCSLRRRISFSCFWFCSSRRKIFFSCCSIFFSKGSLICLIFSISSQISWCMFTSPLLLE